MGELNSTNFAIHCKKVQCRVEAVLWPALRRFVTIRLHVREVTIVNDGPIRIERKFMIRALERELVSGAGPSFHFAAMGCLKVNAFAMDRTGGTPFVSQCKARDLPPPKPRVDHPVS